MGRYVQGFDINQISFLPLSFDEMIDEDNAVRGIDAIVDALDKEKLNFTHTQTKKTGRPPYYADNGDGEILSTFKLTILKS